MKIQPCQFQIVNIVLYIKADIVFKFIFYKLFCLDHHQSFENFKNSMIFINNTTLNLGGNSGLPQTNPLNFDSLINNACENFEGKINLKV